MSTNPATNDVTPIDPDDELLVAYLDGELENRQRDGLEERLLAEPDLREKLQSLQAGWELLDALPSPTTNERLVESTLELVVSDILKVLPPSEAALAAQTAASSPLRRYRWPFVIASVCALLAALGWFGGYQYRRAAEHEQASKLALAENLDAYLWSGDLKLMRLLQSDASWLNMLTTISEIGQVKADTVTVVRDTPVKSRFAVVGQMTAAQRGTLEARWDELSQLDPPTLGKVRETAAAVTAQPDADLLLQTMNSYAAWRSTLPGEMRDAMEKSDGTKRKSAITQAIEFTLQSVSRRSGGMLDEDTVDRIYFALKTFLDERMRADPKLNAAIEQGTQMFGPNAQVFAMSRLVSNDSRGRGRMKPPPGFNQIESLTSSELDSIIGILSDDAIEDLNLLTNWSPYSGHDPRLLESTLLTWAEETVRRKFESMRPERGTLLERYTEMSDQERDIIDLLPPDEMKRRLNGRSRSPFGR